MLAAQQLPSSRHAGERTAERAMGEMSVDADAVTVVAARRVLPPGHGSSVFHTVSTSTPTEKRLARVRFRNSGGGSSRAVLPLPPRKSQREDHSAAVHSNQNEGDIERTFASHESGGYSWRDWDDLPSASLHQERKRDEQRAGEDTLTRSTLRKQSFETSLNYSISNCSSVAFSADCTRVAASASGSTRNVRDDIVARVTTLKVLLDEGFLSQQEYERRKNAIIDELTFASHASSARRSDLRSETRSSITPRNGVPRVVPHAPDFRDVVPEVATKHVFDYASRQWTTSQVYIALDETPFSKGSLRVVYHLQDLNELHFDGSYVAKVAIDPDEDPQTYFRDIELQAHCASYAELYNSYHPPKRVEFLHAWVLELTERGGVLCAVEEFIQGDYRKHNNNFGSVSDDERNTPQAFSHFTYEASSHEVLAVGIQGVGDKYTDPQIHTLNGHDFGKGNLGVLGFQKFMSSHRCNSICRYLKLPQINPKDRHSDRGTLPLQELMNRDRVRPTSFDSKHYYEHAPMLQKYVTQCRELEARHQRRLDRDRANVGGAWKEQLCSRLDCGSSACSIQ